MEQQLFVISSHSLGYCDPIAVLGSQLNFLYNLEDNTALIQSAVCQT